MKNKKKNILIIGSEPGSGSALGPISKRLQYNIEVYCTERASKIFHDEFNIPCTAIQEPTDNIQANKIINDILDIHQPSIVVSTLLGNHETSLDHAAGRVCEQKKIKHIAILDSWVNLESRFNKKGKHFIGLPTITAVPDQFTYSDLLRIGIPSKKLIVTGHPFWDEIRRKVRKYNSKKRQIGFLLQPLYWLIHKTESVNPGYTELSVTKIFFEALDLLEYSEQFIKIILREHPRRNSNYLIPEKYKQKVLISKEGSGWEFVEKCDLVVGMSSTLLLHSFLATIPTIISQPGISNESDQNILTKNGVLTNTTTPESLAIEIQKALTEESFQLDRVSEQYRKKFPTNGDISNQIIRIIKKLSQ